MTSAGKKGKLVSQLRVCDTKVLYDTEYEAEIAARKAEHNYNSPMHHYSCYGSGGVSIPHYHIAHDYKEHRRGAGKGYIKCPSCYLLMKDKPDVIRRHRCMALTEKAAIAA